MPLLLISFILVIGVALIGALCWIWMQGSRASQERQEAHNQRIVALLEEQNQLLRRFVDKS